MVLGIHDGWIAITRGTPDDELIFRKYVMVGDGFEDLINLHCPKTEEPYVSIDLSSLPRDLRALAQPLPAKGLTFPLPPARSVTLPQEISGALVIVPREGAPKLFDEVLATGEFRFRLKSRKGDLVIGTADNGAEIARTFGSEPFRTRNGIVSADLISTQDARARCAKARAS